MGKWDKPQEISNAEYAYSLKINKLLPSMEEIPEEFKVWNGRGPIAQKYIKIANDWFFRGVVIESVVMKDGIDRRTATRHLGAVIHSFEPRHEHKIAGVSYLMSLWFEDIVYKTDVE